MKIFYSARHVAIVADSEPTRGYSRVVTVADVHQLKQELDAFAADDSLPDTLIKSVDVDALVQAVRSGGVYRVVLAAGGVIRNSSDEYLVIDRRGVPDLPKGKAEAGETPIQTAVREVSEETGLKGVNVMDKIGYTYHTYELDGALVVKQTSWFSMTVPGKPMLVPQAEEDISQARWVPRLNMAIEAEKTYKSLRDIFLAVAK